MFPKGIIYKSGFPKKGSFVLKAPKRIKFLFNSLRLIGIIFLCFSFLYLVYVFGPVAQAEVTYATTKKEVVQENLEAVTKPEEKKSYANETDELGINSEFSIYIPKINAKSNILVNIDPGNEKEYMEALKKGVAHTKGTSLPGEGKLIYLFSHSTNSPLYAARFGAVFYLLGKLENEDKIIIYYKDEKFEYEVNQVNTVEASNVSWLEDKNEDETLILQTCTPPGTSWKRLLVIAKRI